MLDEPFLSFSRPPKGASLITILKKEEGAHEIILPASARPRNIFFQFGWYFSAVCVLWTTQQHHNHDCEFLLLLVLILTLQCVNDYFCPSVFRPSAVRNQRLKENRRQKVQLHSIFYCSCTTAFRRTMIANRLFHITGKRQLQRPIVERLFSFSFAGPRSLEDVLKKELVEGKTATEVADIWYTYHENKENVHGLVLKGAESKKLLKRAAASPFFVQPVFRDDGYFMLISQFQSPFHFLMAYLEDFKMDPARAQPLLTFSVFEDFSESKDITLVRADILNRGIADDEGLKIVQNMLDGYTNDDEYMLVNAFNKKPETFDFDDYISRQNEKWREGKHADVEN